MDKVSNTSKRLQQYMKQNDLRQADLLEKCKGRISKSAMSLYISGKRTPVQHPLSILSECLDVSIPWLMGYDVPMSRTESSSPTLSDSEQFVVDSMRGFNAEGQQKVVDYVTDLNESGRYKKFSSSEIA